MLSMSPQQFVTLQSEIRQLSEEYENQDNHCCGVKAQFITASTKVVEDHNKREATKFSMAPPSSSSAPPPTTQISETARSTQQEIARATEKLRLKKFPGDYKSRA